MRRDARPSAAHLSLAPSSRHDSATGAASRDPAVLTRKPNIGHALGQARLNLAGNKTSVSLEDAFWRALKEIACGRQITVSNLVSEIDSERQQSNLSSAIRLFVLDFHRGQLADLKGHGGTHQVADLEEGHGGTHQIV